MKPNSLVFVSLAVLIAGLSVGCGSHEETNPAAPSPPTAASAAPTPGAPSLDYGDAADLAASGLVVQTFHFKDGCSDGRGIQLRFFEAVGMQLTGRTTRLFKMKSGAGANVRLACIKGRNNCVGATTNPPGFGSWGIGINAEKKPSKASCRVCAPNSQSITFRCARHVAGESESLDDEFQLEE